MSEWISYHTGYAGASWPEGDLQRWAARQAAAARLERWARIRRLPDGLLAAEMEDAESFLRSKADPGFFTASALTLRIARREAVIRRGWDARDPRVRREPRDFAGPLDEAAYQAGRAAAALSGPWHLGMYPSTGEAEAARRDALAVCSLAGDAFHDLHRVYGTLMRFLGIPRPPSPGYPQGELAEASLRFTLARDSIRARLLGTPAQDETRAVSLARRFRDACSSLTAVLDGHADPSIADAGEALAKIGTIAEPARDCASYVRDALKEWKPKTTPNELVTRRDWDPAAARELAAARQALIRAQKQIAGSADEARTRRDDADPCSHPGPLPDAAAAGKPRTERRAMYDAMTSNQYPGPDPLEDRRPGSLDELPPSDLDELPPSHLDATNPQPSRRPPGTHQPGHLRNAALPPEGELEAGM